jgi:hypothetical protein
MILCPPQISAVYGNGADVNGCTRDGIVIFGACFSAEIAVSLTALDDGRVVELDINSSTPTRIEASFPMDSCLAAGLYQVVVSSGLRSSEPGQYNLSLCDQDCDQIDNGLDNCPNGANPDQADFDHDGAGDVCDNCPQIVNQSQMDRDVDKVGDVCDNCPTVFNSIPQTDTDGDQIGDACDICPNDAENDIDQDGVCHSQDNCPYVANSKQLDRDGDAIGDACDTCPDGPNQPDRDGDGIGDFCDTCPVLYGSSGFAANCAWNKVFGGSRHDDTRAVIALSDGNYILLGATSSEGAGSYDLLVIKIDDVGQELWRKTYGGLKSDLGKDAQETSDGGLILIGTTYSSVSGDDVWLIKTDVLGRQEWSATFGDIGDDYGWAVTETADQGFILTGDTYSSGSGSNDIFVVKTDSTGNLDWSETIGDTGRDSGLDIIQTHSGEYLVVGETQLSKDPEIDIRAVKLGSDGQVIWSKTFGGSGNDSGRSACEASDDGYIITGLMTDVVRGNEDIYLLKISDQGEKEWARTFGLDKNDLGTHVEQTVDYGYIITGYYNYSTKNSVPLGDLFILKTDINGQQEWLRLYGNATTNDRYDMGYSVTQSLDGGFLVAGETKTYATVPDYYDIWAIKTDAQGQAPAAP